MSTRRSGSPVHQRLSSDLRELIEQEAFGEGERLPTESELADRYQVSRQTVRRAFQDLVAEGLVRRVPGSGTYPVPASERHRYARSIGTIDDLLQWQDSEMEVLQGVTLENDPKIAALLELPGAVVATLTLRRLFDGKPFALSRVALRPDLAQRLVESDWQAHAGTVIGAIQRLLPGAITTVQQEATAVATPEDVAGALDYSAGAPALRVQRIYFDENESPFEVAITHYNPDRYTYRLSLRGQMT
jgi:GntR family transcriptional regulator